MNWIELFNLISEHQTQQGQKNLQEEIKQLWESQLVVLRTARNTDFFQGVCFVVVVFLLLLLIGYSWLGLHRRVRKLEGLITK